jgi:hypothetical protein
VRQYYLRLLGWHLLGRNIQNKISSCNPQTVNARLANSVFQTAFARASFIAAFARSSTVRALSNMSSRLQYKEEMRLTAIFTCFRFAREMGWGGPVGCTMAKPGLKFRSEALTAVMMKGTLSGLRGIMDHPVRRGIGHHVRRAGRNVLTVRVAVVALQ